MESILIYAMLTSAAFYLGSRAAITRWLWGSYPPWLARFMDCSACFGTWAGLGFGMLLSWGPGLSLPSIPAAEWYSPFLIGLCSMVWTPIVAGLMQRGFEQLGSALPEEEPPKQWKNLDG
jgi:hypothetical protein